MNFIIGFMFVLLGIIFVLPFNPYNCLDEVIFFLKGFFPLFIFFIGILMIAIHIFSSKKEE